MQRTRANLVVLAVTAIAGIAAPLCAQIGQEIPTVQLKIKQVSNAALPPVPFSQDGAYSRTGDPVEFRSVDQMTSQDRDLAADAESSINERAGFDGIVFDQGKWSYQQLRCRALPGHMFLKFTRNNGSGDESMFTASIPRGGDGRVRIIPILRRGYSLFSPAPINALTISAFNHIRVEEHPEGTVDWMDTALCYAALSGALPKVEIPADSLDNQALSLAQGPLMEVPLRGGAIIHFSDVATPRPMEWTLTFDAKGRLLKAWHRPASVLTVKVVEPAAEESQPKTIVPKT